MPDPDKPETLPVEIGMNALGQGTVVVDGVDLSRYVRQIYISGGVDAQPQVILDIVAAVEVQAEAKVLINRLPPVPVGGAVDLTSLGDTCRRRRPAGPSDT